MCPSYPVLLAQDCLFVPLLGGFSPVLVYKVTNLANGKIYIGKWMRECVQARWNKHVADARLNRGCPLLGRAIRKYGPEGFVIEVICQSWNRKDLGELEKLCVAQYKSNQRKYGYNLTPGGDGAPFGEGNPMWGRTHSDGVKAKMRALRLGSKQTEETKRKISDASRGENNGFYGKTHTSERALEGCRKGGRSHLGKKRTKEQCQHISQALTGLVHSVEHCQRISEAKKGQGLGRKHSPEAIARMSEIKRAWWAAKKELVA
jgi:group I intron endonuclease